MKKVAIIQSNYIPWKGYFDIINDADLFVFLDDVQFTTRDWRNRNKIKTDRGPQWITIPVGSNRNRLIHEVALEQHDWQKSHWQIICDYGKKTPHFSNYQAFLKEAFLAREWSNLSELNQWLIKTISRDFLGITTQFADSRAFSPMGANQDRLIDILKKVDASHYISGPAAKSYIDPEKFSNARIEVIWKNYDGYPDYTQPYPPFEHGVSVLDLLFNTGSNASDFIWGWR